MLLCIDTNIFYQDYLLTWRIIRWQNISFRQLKSVRFFANLFELKSSFFVHAFILVFPFCILLCSLFTLYAIANIILSAVTFCVPRLRYLRKDISCFNSPKEPSAWMLRFIRNIQHSSVKIRSRSSLRCFWNNFAT